MIFLKRHIIICILCLVSGFIIAKYSNIPAPVWLPDFVAELLLRPQAETISLEWFEILNNLSLAFIASIITYIVIQYIPERRKAYKAFAFLKNNLYKIYEDMSYIISIYLFEIGIENSEKQITLKQLSSLPGIGISDVIKSSRIETLINGKNGNIVKLGYNLLDDSIRHADAIQKNIGHVKEAMYSAQLDTEIIDTLSTIENNLLLRCFHNSNITRLRNKALSFQHNIFNLDKGFYEFIQCHLSLNKFNFDKITYNIIMISEEEMKTEKEETLFMSNRTLFRILGADKVVEVVETIIGLEPTEERLQKSIGILLEILVYYDSEVEKSIMVLQEALKIAEYIRANELNSEHQLCNLLNYLQVKKRQNTLSHEDIEDLNKIISSENAPDNIVLGASIICENHEIALEAFERLTDDAKATFIQFPIYHLWHNPPVEPNPNPPLFNTF